MNALKLCRICLNTGVKLYRKDQYHLQSYYEEMIDIVEEFQSLKIYFCYECATFLQKVNKFKEKCEVGQRVLSNLLHEGTLTEDTIYRTKNQEAKLKPMLSLIPPLILSTITDKSSAELPLKVELVDEEDPFIKEEPEVWAFSPIPDAHNYVNEENDNKQHIIEQPMANDESNKNSIMEYENASILPEILKKPIKKSKTKKSNKPKIVIVCERKVSVREKIEKVKFAKQKASAKKFDPNKWKVVHLSEEEAAAEYNKQRDAEKTEFHCKYCYKNFISADTLKRHLKVHSKSLGTFECSLCRRRFKWCSLLRLHMKTHLCRYHCLRCFRVFRHGYVAKQHELMHDGISYQCQYCEMKFTKKSSYYTHLRELHRSGHVCDVCGESFLSALGLNKHRIHKHCDESKDITPEQTTGGHDTHCEKCNITFRTVMAYDQHFRNSDMHGGDSEQDKGLNAKPKLFNSSTTSNSDQFTCNQCSERFFTNKAYERHMSLIHNAPPENKRSREKRRWICEICGANLALGSMKVHQNMHLKKLMKKRPTDSPRKQFPCARCHKLFNSAWNREQHQTTHTGLKPYSCKVCDKKFTQQQAVLKHFRRYH